MVEIFVLQLSEQVLLLNNCFGGGLAGLLLISHKSKFSTVSFLMLLVREHSLFTCSRVGASRRVFSECNMVSTHQHGC